MASTPLRDDQEVIGTVTFVDKKGSPASIDGVPIWASSNEAVATVSASADGLTATVKAVAPGSAQISVTADADLGEGVLSITATGDIDVAGGQASTVQISFGVPTDQA